MSTLEIVLQINKLSDIRAILCMGNIFQTWQVCFSQQEGPIPKKE